MESLNNTINKNMWFEHTHHFVQNFEIQLQQALLQKLTVRPQWNINQFQKVELTCAFVFYLSYLGL